MPAVINPAMSDGRAMTNYMSRCQLNAMLQSKLNALSESDYRSQMQNNPKAFDTAARSYVQFEPYWGVNSCPKAAQAQEMMVRQLPGRK